MPRGSWAVASALAFALSAAGGEAPVRTPHVTVMGGEPAVAAQLAARLEHFNAFLARSLGAELPGPYAVRLFADRDALRAHGRAHVAGFDDAWAGGYDHATRELLLCPLDDGWAVARHEATHQALHALNPDEPNWPRWFAEGFADYCARGAEHADAYALNGEVDARDAARVRALLARDAAPPFATFLADRSPWRGEADADRYAQAYTLVHYLAEAAGHDLRSRWTRLLRAVVTGKTYDQAWAAAFAGVAPELIERRWRAWVVRDR